MTSSGSQDTHGARRPPRRDAGFTLLEVMIALLIASIGLLGTLAVQQTVLLMVGHARDAQIANHLAAEALETINARVVSAGPPPRDQLCPLFSGSTCPVWPSTTLPTVPTGTVQRCACETAGGQTTTITCPAAVPDTVVALEAAGCVAERRFFQQVTIVNPVLSQPYRISVWMIYAADSERTKQVRLDAQKWKTW